MGWDGMGWDGMGWDGMWELPGGGPDPGEPPTDTLVREIMEETGLTATILDPNPKYMFGLDRPGRDTGGFWIAYHVALDSLDFTPSDECIALKFFDKQSVKTVDTYNNVTTLFELFDPSHFS